MIKTEEKAKVVPAAWGTELMNFLAALDILHQDKQQQWPLPSILYLSFFYAVLQRHAAGICTWKALHNIYTVPKYSEYPHTNWGYKLSGLYSRCNRICYFSTYVRTYTRVLYTISGPEADDQSNRLLACMYNVLIINLAAAAAGGRHLAPWVRAEGTTSRGWHCALK